MIELKAYADERGLPFFAISAVTGMGVNELINHLGESVVRSRQGDDGRSKSVKLSKMVESY